MGPGDRVMCADERCSQGCDWQHDGATERPGHCASLREQLSKHARYVADRAGLRCSEAPIRHDSQVFRCGTFGAAV